MHMTYINFSMKHPEFGDVTVEAEVGYISPTTTSSYKAECPTDITGELIIDFIEAYDSMGATVDTGFIKDADIIRQLEIKVMMQGEYEGESADYEDFDPFNMENN